MVKTPHHPRIFSQAATPHPNQQAYMTSNISNSSPSKSIFMSKLVHFLPSPAHWSGGTHHRDDCTADFGRVIERAGLEASQIIRSSSLSSVGRPKRMSQRPPTLRTTPSHTICGMLFLGHLPHPLHSLILPKPSPIVFLLHVGIQVLPFGTALDIFPAKTRGRENLSPRVKCEHGPNAVGAPTLQSLKQDSPSDCCEEVATFLSCSILALFRESLTLHLTHL